MADSLLYSSPSFVQLIGHQIPVTRNLQISDDCFLTQASSLAGITEVTSTSSFRK
jgi:hypothetical protein